jgi:hypothetical protein
VTRRPFVVSLSNHAFKSPYRQRRLSDFVPKAAPGLAPAGDLLSCSRKKVSKEALPASPA